MNHLPGQMGNHQIMLGKGASLVAVEHQDIHREQAMKGQLWDEKPRSEPRGKMQNDQFAEHS